MLAWATTPLAPCSVMVPPELAPLLVVCTRMLPPNAVEVTMGVDDTVPKPLTDTLPADSDEEPERRRPG